MDAGRLTVKSSRSLRSGRNLEPVDNSVDKVKLARLIAKDSGVVKTLALTDRSIGFGHRNPHAQYQNSAGTNA
jgi:hypothetical protein